MKKEFKIGMFIGLLVIIAAVLYFATRKSNSVEERALTTDAVTEANFPSIDVNAPNFDVNTATPLPGSTDYSDANASASTETGSTSSAADSTIYEQADPIKTQKFHIVRKGDTLSSISQKYYGSSKYITKIYEANRGVMKSKNSLNIGMKLTIPE